MAFALDVTKKGKKECVRESNVNNAMHAAFAVYELYAKCNDEPDKTTVYH